MDTEKDQGETFETAETVETVEVIAASLRSVLRVVAACARLLYEIHITLELFGTRTSTVDYVVCILVYR